jgi:hypothetical protein
MYTLISTFEYSSYLELAIGEIQHLGIEKKDIYAIPLDQRAETVDLFDTIHKADGKSLTDLAAILGCVGMLLGVIYGFVLQWGPILCGFLGLVIGALLGGFLDLTLTRKERNRKAVKKDAEVILYVVCPDHLTEKIEGILWKQFALGMAKIKR